MLLQPQLWYSRRLLTYLYWEALRMEKDAWRGLNWVGLLISHSPKAAYPTPTPRSPVTR
jgi:hypothetical protein